MTIAADAQTSQTTADKKELRKDLRTEHKERKDRRQNEKAAKLQSKKAVADHKIANAAGKHGMDKLADRADDAADRSEAKSATDKANAANDTKKIKSINKEVHQDAATLASGWC